MKLPVDQRDRRRPGISTAQRRIDESKYWRTSRNFPLSTRTMLTPTGCIHRISGIGQDRLPLERSLMTLRDLVDELNSDALEATAYGFIPFADVCPTDEAVPRRHEHGVVMIVLPHFFDVPLGFGAPIRL